MQLEPANPDYHSLVEQNFHAAAFINDVGIKLGDFGPGWCETFLDIQPRHLQHSGVVHAGVQSTIADHTAGAAAISLAREDEIVLTVEFKIHLLRPGKGESLWCRAEVLKPGRNFYVTESEVFAVTGSKKTLVSKFSGTMAVVAK